jgi:hypothetical protein
MKKTLFILFLFLTSFSWAQSPFFRVGQAPNHITHISIVSFKNVKIESMMVLNLQGNLVFSYTKNIEEEMRRLNKLPQGIYKVIFSTGNRNITRTIIKQ